MSKVLLNDLIELEETLKKLTDLLELWNNLCVQIESVKKAPEQSKIFRARPLLRTKLIVAIEMEMCSIYDHLHNSVQSLGKIAKALNEFDCKPNISFTFKVDMKYILIYLEEVINWWAKHNCCDFYLHRALRFESPNQRTQKAICRVKNDLSLSTRYKIEII